eukprot:COSAG06_NODE_1798_length_8368_cov_4.946668_6_plen_180_part_00
MQKAARRSSTGNSPGKRNRTCLPDPAHRTDLVASIKTGAQLVAASGGRRSSSVGEAGSQAVSGGRQAQSDCRCQSQPVERLPNITFLRQSISSRCSTYSWTNPSDRHVLAALTTAPNITGRRAGRPSRPGRGGASAAAAVPEAQPLLSLLLLQRTGRLSELTGRVIGQRRARRMKRSDD